MTEIRKARRYFSPGDAFVNRVGKQLTACLPIYFKVILLAKTDAVKPAWIMGLTALLFVATCSTSD
jgi:hypothetical protein